MSCRTFGMIIETINQVQTNTKMKLKDTTTVAVNIKLLLRLEVEPNEIHEPCTRPSEQNTCITASTQIGRTNKSFNYNTFGLISTHSCTLDKVDLNKI